LYIEEGQPLQWTKENGEKNRQWFTKHYTENQRSHSTHFTKDSIDIIRKTLVSAIFRQFGICFGLFDIAG